MNFNEIYNEAEEHLLKHYQSGQFLYPTVIRHIFGLEEDQTDKVIKKLVNNGILHIYLNPRCPFCNNSLRNLYSTKKEIPNELYCTDCNKDITEPERYCETIYEVRKWRKDTTINKAAITAVLMIDAHKKGNDKEFYKQAEKLARIYKNRGEENNAAVIRKILKDVK